jgi:hypothetical protein
LAAATAPKRGDDVADEFAAIERMRWRTSDKDLGLLACDAKNGHGATGRYFSH